jgi:hypothetical protein
VRRRVAARLPLAAPLRVAAAAVPAEVLAVAPRRVVAAAVAPALADLDGRIFRQEWRVAQFARRIPCRVSPCRVGELIAGSPAPRKRLALIEFGDAARLKKSRERAGCRYVIS